MSLSQARITPQIAVTDMARAQDFYEGKLGLTGGQGKGELTRTYPCGDGTMLSLYVSAEHAGGTSATQARWDVDDLEMLVDELVGRGVVFEQYGDPVPTNEKGIHDSGYGKIAWVLDPDGNTFEICQTD
jgi:catechol 2,3-dioxygenase-like lactoylglutathione lyase family enzyme